MPRPPFAAALTADTDLHRGCFREVGEPAGVERWIELHLPASSGLFAHLSGAEIAAHMEISASGGTDQRLLSFLIP